jgi:ABC-type sugar transport system permease subunit
VVPYVWIAVGFYAVLFYAIFQDIPRELYEVADIEGAGNRQKMLRITAPLVIPFMGPFLIWELIGSFNAFQSIIVLTQGGPGNVSNILGYYAYENAFLFRRLGYSCSLSVLTFLICILLALIIQRLTKRDYQF